jgi:hypothetical protein
VAFVLSGFRLSVRINIGTGEDVTIREPAETVFRVLGFDGAPQFTA